MSVPACRPAQLALCLLLGSLAAAPVCARPLDQVKQTGKLVIAVYDDFAPYSFVKDGKPEGVDVALGRKLAEAIGVEPEFMVRQAGDSIDDDLRLNIWRGSQFGGGVADVMLHVPVDKELGIRNELSVIFGRYYTERMGLLVDPDVVGTNTTLAPFTDHKIGVEVETLADGYLSSPYTAAGRFAEQVVRYRRWDEAIEGLKAREVAGLLGPRAQLEYAAAVAGREVKVVDAELPALRPDHWEVGMAVKTDSRDLGYALGDAVTALRKSGAMEKLYADHGLTYFVDTPD